MELVSNQLLQQLREQDFDRYLACLFAAENARSALITLYCFHNEIARIGDAVSEPLPGEIRLQWWRDALSGLRDGEAQQNPLATALLEVTRANPWIGRRLQRLIDARAQDLYNEPIETRDAFNARLSAISGTLYRVSAELAAGRELDDADDMARAAHHAGQAEGVIGVIRNLGFDARQNRLYLPLDLLAEQGIHTRQLLNGDAPDGLDELIAGLIARAETGLESCANLLQGKTRRERDGFLPAYLIKPWIKVLRAQKADWLTQQAEVSALRKFWTLFRRSL